MLKVCSFFRPKSYSVKLVWAGPLGIGVKGILKCYFYAEKVFFWSWNTGDRFSLLFCELDIHKLFLK